MIFFDEVQHKIQSTAFFSNMGKAALQADNVILFSGLESLLLSELDFIWLPTSPTQDDPFYTKQTLPKALIEQRIKITRCVMDSVKNIPCTPFQYNAHDFNIMPMISILQLKMRLVTHFGNTYQKNTFPLETTGKILLIFTIKDIGQ